MRSFGGGVFVNIGFEYNAGMHRVTTNVSGLKDSDLHAKSRFNFTCPFSLVSHGYILVTQETTRSKMK